MAASESPEKLVSFLNSIFDDPMILRSNQYAVKADAQFLKLKDFEASLIRNLTNDQLGEVIEANRAWTGSLTELRNRRLHL